MAGDGQRLTTSTTLRLPPRVLLVGRSGADAEWLVQRLGSEGYMVLQELEFARAFARLRTDRVEFAVVDVDAPGGGGEAFIEALRGDSQLEGLPVLVTSRRDEIAAIERCLESGADDYLPSVFGPAVLRVRISAALDRRRLQDSDNLRREMAVARNIQRDFLPESLPDVDNVELEAALRPARDVSGDFYDCFTLASGEVIIVVGDVCDKGVGAALFMALFRSLIRASADPVGGGAIQMIGGRHTVVMQALKLAKPAELLTRVAGFTNDYIARLHGRTNMFATVFLASVDPYSGELVYVNAGHEPALVIAPDGGVDELRPTGPALGMLPDSHFTAVTRKLERGHVLFAFTDGLVEAHSPTGEVYGAERLRAVLRSASGQPTRVMVHAVLDALQAFGQHSTPHDDLTVLAARRI